MLLIRGQVTADAGTSPLLLLEYQPDIEQSSHLQALGVWGEPKSIVNTLIQSLDGIELLSLGFPSPRVMSHEKNDPVLV